MSAAVHTLRLVLGDQLSPTISSLRDIDPVHDIVVLLEVASEATYVPHHKKKIAFLFAAMRHFADGLRRARQRVHYTTLDDPDNAGSFAAELQRLVALYKPQRIVVTEPGEWRVRQDIASWAKLLGVPVDMRDDTRFIASHADFAAWAKGKKQLRMEFFYREMRRKTGLLLTDDGEPEGGQWNYDAENRKPLKDATRFLPRRQFTHDKITSDVLALVAARFDTHFGTLAPFNFAVTAADAKQLLDDFINEYLPNYGDYQDAMQQGEAFLFHSVLSPYINAGLLDPLECCRRAAAAYKAGRAPLNAVEGFIRQIIGWREYIRGIYWLHMPDYVTKNALHATRPLPDFYWTADTDMNCLREVVTQTRDYAYSHHIQRLMVTGNFALLAGLLPEAVCEWYLAVYADAYEWVELPNTLGMALYGDGGIVASKPYAASGKYISRMSNFCASCKYDVEETVGPTACPFNALYWHFLWRHQALFSNNPRMSMIYSSFKRMSAEKQAAILQQAEAFLTQLR